MQMTVFLKNSTAIPRTNPYASSSLLKELIWDFFFFFSFPPKVFLSLITSLWKSA